MRRKVLADGLCQFYCTLLYLLHCTYCTFRGLSGRDMSAEEERGAAGEVQLAELLEGLVRKRGRVAAAEALGINCRTLVRSIETGTPSRRRWRVVWGRWRRRFAASTAPPGPRANGKRKIRKPTGPAGPEARRDLNLRLRPGTGAVEVRHRGPTDGQGRGPSRWSRRPARKRPSVRRRAGAEWRHLRSLGAAGCGGAAMRA